MMKKLAPLLAVLAALAGVSIAWLWRNAPNNSPPAEMFAWRPIGADLPKLFPAPSFSEKDQQGGTTTNATLRGRPWIVDFIYTQCTSACPMMTSRLVLLQRALKGSDVQFVSFSVDPANDTPDVLAAYAKQWNASETRWTLLATRPEDLKAVVDGFHVTAEPSGDPANRITHSSVFLLVDSQGSVRAVYDSNDRAAMERLVADVRRVASPAPQASAAADQRGLYRALGCAGCHADKRIAPPLEGLHGHDVALSDGSHVIADDAYLRRSILEPGDQIVAGYPPLMPSYAEALSDAQVTELVQETDAMNAVAAGPPEAPAQLVTDPVCGMTVRAAPETLHLEHDGKVLYFCSESCRQAFRAHPEAHRETAASK